MNMKLNFTSLCHRVCVVLGAPRFPLREATALLRW